MLKARFPRTLVIAASSRGGPSDEGDGAALKAGMLVEYRKDTNKHVLVLLAEPNGKINWFGVDAVRGIWGGREHGVLLIEPIDNCSWLGLDAVRRNLN